MREYESVLVALRDEITVDRIVGFSDKLYEIWEKGGRVYIAGNGGSASTASHFASDLTNLGFDVVCMTDNISRITALTNDKGWGKIYTEQMTHFNEKDALVLITVHGCEGAQDAGPWSKNLLEAAYLALDRDGEVLVLSGNNGGFLAGEICARFLTISSQDVNVVEGIHLVLTHLICADLKRRLKK